MVVVGAVVLGFEVVATIEELANVSATGSFNDESATWVVRSIISSVDNKVVEEKQVALSFSCDGIELIFGHGGDGSPELLELADIDLMANFHKSPSAKEENDNSNIKEKRTASESDVLGFDSCGNTVNAK